MMYIWNFVKSFIRNEMLQVYQDLQSCQWTNVKLRYSSCYYRPQSLFGMLDLIKLVEKIFTLLAVGSSCVYSLWSASLPVREVVIGSVIFH